jgi:hypothetical protein
MTKSLEHLPVFFPLNSFSEVKEHKDFGQADAHSQQETQTEDWPRTYKESLGGDLVDDQNKRVNSELLKAQKPLQFRYG